MAPHSSTRLAFVVLFGVVLVLLVVVLAWTTNSNDSGDSDSNLFGFCECNNNNNNKKENSITPSPSSSSSSSCSRSEYDIYEHRRLKNWVLGSEDHERLKAANDEPSPKDYCWRRPRLIIFSQQRSGTHWLQQLLNSHPDVDIAPELAKHLGTEKEQLATDEDSVVRYVSERRSGLILQFNTLMNKAPGLLHKFVREHYGVAHLVRTNSLDMIISEGIDRQTGVVHCHLGENCTVRQSTIKLDTSRLLVQIDLLEQEKHLSKALLETMGARWFTLTYDELESDPSGFACKALNFMGCTCPPDIASTLTKGVVKPRNEVIENWEEVQQTLRNTNYEHFLYS